VIQQVLVNGRYEVLRELGAGGSGCVYAATDRTTDKLVAVKLFGYHIQWDRTAREKFEIEAKVSGRVQSEHIVQVSDAGIDPLTQLPFLVMELLEGKNFQELVEQGGQLSPGLVVDYLSQVASGLHKAHGRNDRDGRLAPIVHRDLKPGNLFLAHHEDGAPLVKILDWGIAKILSSSITMSGDVRGTPLYMAPEQISVAPVTPATDIWALGLVAFFLLAGRCYWKSATLEYANMPAILKEVCEGPVVLPRMRMRELGVSVDCPPAFDQWFMQCVNVNPAQRFQHARDAVRALGNALGCASRESQPPSGSLLPYSRELGFAKTANPNSVENSAANRQRVQSQEPASPGRIRATLGRSRLSWVALSSVAVIVALGAVLGLARVPSTLPPNAVSTQVVAPRPLQTSLETQAALRQAATPAQIAPTVVSTSSSLLDTNKRGGRRPTLAPTRAPPVGSAVEPNANEHPGDSAADSPLPSPLIFDRLTGPAPSTHTRPVRSVHDLLENPP
jgi:eukaryotic-like serine/threonine-protein kinase